jgi:hypothetical protein
VIDFPVCQANRSQYNFCQINFNLFNIFSIFTINVTFVDASGEQDEFSVSACVSEDGVIRILCQSKIEKESEGNLYWTDCLSFLSSSELKTKIKYYKNSAVRTKL